MSHSIRILKSTLSKAFEKDPTITYLLSSLTPSKRLAYLPQYFHVILSAAASNNGIFDEIDNWKSCGVLMPPGKDVANP
jgi:hypothetical protein